ncbi:MAG: Crp/Fnr family transcriptional regulator [Termitinemataceae bacterium]|nr:MAG: Crp/Fnr family transcriptional regulator [Termitinemataceae bacterium]
MEKYLPILKHCPLFYAIEEQDILGLLDCLKASNKEYDKDDLIYCAGDEISSVGIVLTGAIHIENDDYWGNRTIISRISPGEMFGESFSFTEDRELSVSITTAEPTKIILIDYMKIIRVCSSSCKFHTRLIQNILKNLACKNIALVSKMEFITQRTTREKLLSYLSTCARNKKSASFTIPFNRQELADFLSVERSAMSAELGRMRNEGLVVFNKNQFNLCK